MADQGSSSLFEDTLKIDEIDSNGKMFQHVSRIEGVTQLYEVKVTLDIHSDLYPVNTNEFHSILITNSLTVENSDDQGYYSLHTDYSNSLLEKYDYCMYGKIYRHSQEKGNYVVHISFGGLLMMLSGSHTYLVHLELDSNVYCLLRKVL